MNNGIRSRPCLLLWVILAVLFCQVIMSSYSVVSAESWSWSAAKPTTFSSGPIPDILLGDCPNAYKIKKTAGERNFKKICGVDGISVNFGTDDRFQPFVGFSYDSNIHKLNGMCGPSDGCLYLPDSDTLVTKQYLVNGIVRSLVVYKNFTHRLTRFFNTANLTTEYNFDASSPDYIFQNSSGYAWPVGGIGASNNGKWLAIEIRQRGIVLLNIETLQMKRISTMALSYGIGLDPTSELAVSNDGQNIALIGTNSGFTIFDITPDCGDEATDDRMSSVTPIAQPCPISPVNTEDFIHSFFQASHPSFNDDGGEFSFYASSYTGEALEVSLHAAGYGGQRMDYLALGDSFSSGEGESDDGYYLDGTNDEFEKCHVSTRSYPYLIADLSGIDRNYMRSVACSGATMVDVIGQDSFYLGQNERLGHKGFKLDDSGAILAQTEAKNLFIPGRIHQVKFLNEYRPKVVTIGIGGNDAGFMSKLKSCIGPDTCNWAIDPQRKEQTAIEIKNLFGKLVNTYSELHTVSPNSKIYAIGYPKIISEVDECDPLIGFLLNSSERKFMNEGIIYLNQVIAAAAQKAGIKYLDIQESYGNQVLCSKVQPSAMNTIRTGDDTSIIGQQNWFKFIGQESFHPNHLGHYYASQSIIGSIGNILSFNNCNNTTICPVDVDVPEPSIYWIPDGYHSYPLQKSLNFVAEPQPTPDNLQDQLTLPDLSFEPNSIVNVEIHSTPQPLGQFTASESGALDINVNLPANLEEGYHVIHIFGTSYSGEAIDLYQTIEFKIPAITPDNPPEIIQPVATEPKPSVDVHQNNKPTPTSGNHLSNNSVLLSDNSNNSDINHKSGNVADAIPSKISTQLDQQPILGASTPSTYKSQNSIRNSKNKQLESPLDYIPTLTVLVILLITLILLSKRRRKHRLRSK